MLIPLVIFGLVGIGGSNSISQERLVLTRLAGGWKKNLYHTDWTNPWQRFSE